MRKPADLRLATLAEHSPSGSSPAGEADLAHRLALWLGAVSAEAAKEPQPGRAAAVTGHARAEPPR